MVLRGGQPPVGFTLVELLITVVIVSLLATAALPMTELTVKRGHEQELRTALRQIREAIDAYKHAADQGRVPKAADESGYPKNLDLLVEGVVDIKDPNQHKIYFLRQLPGNPFWPDSDTPPAATWGKRSYESSHDDPQEGSDVFDVYVPSLDIGLNGIPYREW